MYKLLIVDDENLVRVAFRTMVNYEEYGFTICGTAADGEEALQIYARETPDLVITDIKMPHMDGIELIRRLKAQGSNSKIVLISNYDDFNLVRQGMVLGAQDYLLKLTITEQEYADMLLRMKKELDETASQREQHEFARTAIKQMEKEKQTVFWRTLLLASVVDKKDIPDRLFQDQPLDLFLIQVVQYGQVMEISSQKDMELLNYALLNIAAELLGPEVLCQGAVANGQYFMITACHGKGKDRQEFLAQRLGAALTQYLNITVGIFFGPAISDADELLAALSGRRQMSDDLFYARDSAPILLSPVRKFGAWNVNIPQLVSDMSAALRHSDLEGAVQQVNRHLETCREVFAAREEVLHKWATVLLLLHERMEGFLLDGAEGDPSGQIYQLGTTTQLHSFLCGSLKRILQALKPEPGNTGANEVDKALQYIHAHIDEKISLSQLAQHVNFNETYLCTVFRSRTGTSIINYINQTKMEKAAERLSREDVLLKTLAAELGFSDQFYFNKMFRKYYGVSPSEYRKRQRDITNSQ